MSVGVCTQRNYLLEFPSVIQICASILPAHIAGVILYLLEREKYSWKIYEEKI